MKKTAKLDANKHCVEFTATDKSKHTITLIMLEKLWNQALNANKQPFIVIGMRRNDSEMFTINGELKVEKQRRSK